MIRKRMENSSWTKRYHILQHLFGHGRDPFRHLIDGKVRGIQIPGVFCTPEGRDFPVLVQGIPLGDPFLQFLQGHFRAFFLQLQIPPPGPFFHGSRQEYLQAESAWLSSEASHTAAKLDLTGAIENYQWALEGLLDIGSSSQS